ncbi:MAG: FAD-dependent monooxygenase [Paracoccaceae bacterium]
MLKDQPVSVLGAGIGGLTTALALARHGARVQVLEQAREISELGAGLQITPNGVAVLNALGLGDELRRIAVSPSSIRLRSYRDGGCVLRLDLARFGEDRGYYLVHRADLVEMLGRAAVSAGISFRFAHQATQVRETDKGVDVRFVGGGHETFALMIAADGLHSKLRPALNGASEPFFTGHVAWRATVPNTGAARGGISVFMGPGSHLVCYPLRANALINIVAVVETGVWSAEGWHHPGDPEEMRRAFSGYCAEVRALLKQVETVNKWGLFRHPVARRWFGEHSALVGDAAHPTLPFLAQGANMALEDAWVLADCLAHQPRSEALSAYQRRRQPRVGKVLAAANANARAFHLRNPALRGVAHSVLRVAGRLGPDMMNRRFDWVYRHDVTRG